MNVSQRIKAFASLGDYLRNLSTSDLEEISNNAANENTWFTPQSVKDALASISQWLTEDRLAAWTSRYQPVAAPKTVGLVMAGNIPLVGFHDLMAVLISGHHAQVKLSSKDRFLPKLLIGKLISLEPAFTHHIVFVERLKSFDAVIATGSDNSARYFDYYFGKYQNIVRKNRTSAAILTGSETTDDISELGRDIFTYFGLGCRNVSKLFAPRGYTFDYFFEGVQRFSSVLNHHKYANNYDYQKSLLLINQQPFLDNGFLLLQESEKSVSPISVLYYEFFDSDAHLKAILDSHREKTQVIVGNYSPLAELRFGEAQCPGLMDYADKIDTMKFLSELS